MKHISKTNQIVLLLCSCFLGTLLVLGCDSAENKSTDLVHSCTLLTIQEVEKIIGATVEQPPQETLKEDKKSDFWMSMCNWYAPDADISLSVMIRPLPPERKTPHAAFEAYTKSMGESMPEYKMTPVDGIGAKAVWNGPTGQLTIFNGSHLYIVSTLIKDAQEKEKLELVKKISQLVLLKMK